MHRGRYSKAPPFVWRNDSKAILGVRQDTMRPSGFALGPLSPIEIPNDGEPHPLPLLKDVAGGLDGLLLVGTSGLALAEFGTKGKHYSPGHDDPTATPGQNGRASGRERGGQEGESDGVGVDLK